MRFLLYLFLLLFRTKKKMGKESSALFLQSTALLFHPAFEIREESSCNALDVFGKEFAVIISAEGCKPFIGLSVDDR